MLDVQTTKKEALKVLKQLESQGVNVNNARRDLKQKSPFYNIYYQRGMTGPVITYATR